MVAAGVSNQDHLLLDSVVAMTIGSAGLNGVVVVKAAADRVAFGDLDTHDGDGVVRDRCL